ncbi:MAG: ABC transporter ATP-binding protein [Gammaproteobacteria bacterium]
MNNSSDYILQAERLVKQVNSPAGVLTILDDVSLALKKGDTLAVTGVSGSGKSTLLAILAGLDLPSSGRVFMHGTDLTTLNEDGRAALRKQRVGFVFQSFQLLPAMTALENVMLPLELTGRRDAAQVATSHLEAVGLGQRLGHYPNQLSGGEQQRVAIARAFAGQPQLLFADEPTGNLDQATARQVIDLLFELNRSHHTTLVMVTHDPSIAGHCSKTLALAGGRIVS